MPPFGPVKRTELIRNLRKAGYTGPNAGGNHQYMTRDNLSVRIPNPHQGDIGPGLLSRILRQAEITREEWGNL